MKNSPLYSISDESHLAEASGLLTDCAGCRVRQRFEEGRDQTYICIYTRLFVCMYVYVTTHKGGTRRREKAEKEEEEAVVGAEGCQRV